MFKGVLYSLTDVPPQNQTIMCKGKIIKDGTDWKDYPGIKDGC